MASRSLTRQKDTGCALLLRINKVSGGWACYQHDEGRHRVPQALNRPSGDRDNPTFHGKTVTFAQRLGELKRLAAVSS